MKNLYKETLEEIRLDEGSKERIFNNVVNKLKEEKDRSQNKKRVSFSMKAFRVAAACASVALICGTALGTGLYYGLGGNGVNGEDDGWSEVEIPRYLCYYIGYELEKDEYDLDNVEVNLYYAFDETAVRGRYNQVIQEAKDEGYGEVLKYEIILSVTNFYYGRESSGKKVILDRLNIDKIDEFPFDDYRINIVEENGEIVERTYTHSERIVIPQELFVETIDSNNSWVKVSLYERIEYEIGCQKNYNPYSDYWSDDKKVANDYGYVTGFCPVDDCRAVIYYKLDNNKVIINNNNVGDHCYLVGGKLVAYHVRSNFSPIYKKQN